LLPQFHPALCGRVQPARRGGGGQRVALTVFSPPFPQTVINAITVALKNSPLNAGKKALAIAQGGGQETAEAYVAKVDALIAKNKVR
jgi:hypothetical protein